MSGVSRRTRGRSRQAWFVGIGLAWVVGAGLAGPTDVQAQTPRSAPASGVRIWEDSITLPTYRVDAPDRNPIFYSGEAYQGAQRRVYPYALMDKVTRIREDRAYTAVHLENEYIALTVLPELGGRLFSATDKTNGYDFFYRQHVIKPALIGMLGAWISGGIEWCVFHHHRNTTFMPVDYTLTEQDDGSKTIWVGEIERRHRMKWLIGLTLYPGRSSIEATVRFFNRTPFAHSILYWANVAVHANDDYQVLFPPSVQAATYHSKNQFISWPIGDGPYQGVDYTGVDLSRWPNHPAPISFFAWNLEDDFSGGYDHGRDAGFVHVANHHVVAGTKLWEWGPGPRGRMWDEILTDDDGPYAELMVGAFSDNQPDYSWIGPHEVKTFTQHWYPVRDIGGFKQANLDAAVNLEVSDGFASIGLNSTARVAGARVRLVGGARTLLERTVEIAPDRPFVESVELPDGLGAEDLEVELRAPDGRVLIRHRPSPPAASEPLPTPVEPPKAPDQIATNDELFQTGLRLLQMHSPQVPPDPYFEEALRRDPGDARVNTIVGTLLNQRGLYVEAERHLRAALARLSVGYIRARDTDAEYQLGLALRGQGRLDAAYTHVYRATWDAANRTAAYYQLAELSIREHAWTRARDELEAALETNSRDTKALGLSAAVLRRLGRPAEAAALADRVLAIDPLNTLALNEAYLAHRAAGRGAEAAEALTALSRTLRDAEQAYLELAIDYGNVAMWDEAIELLERLVSSDAEFASGYPIVHYYLGYLQAEAGHPEAADAAFRHAAEQSPDYVFPFRLEMIAPLEQAIAANPDDDRAHYYLGNLLYEIQPERAVTHWERSRELRDDFPTVHRNLGWAYYRTRGDVPLAIASYERAIACDPRDTRLFAELDELYEIGNVPVARRHDLLTSHLDVVSERSDSLLRALIVQVLGGEYDQAIALLDSHEFAVAEGGGRVHDVFVDAHLLRGYDRLAAGDARAALADFERAASYPANLSVGRPRRDRRAPQVAFYTGLAFEALENQTAAEEAFERALDQPDTERWPDTRVYQARAALKLGRLDAATAILTDVLAAAESGLADLTLGAPDFFAKFGNRAPEAARRSRLHYLQGLALAAMGRMAGARHNLQQAIDLDTSQLWARHALATLR